MQVFPVASVARADGNVKKRSKWKNLQTNISHFDKKAVHLLRLSSPDAISVAADAGKRTANAELNCKVLIWKQREKNQ